MGGSQAGPAPGRRSPLAASAKHQIVTCWFPRPPSPSEAGRRIVAIPELITPDLAAHVVTYARPGDDGLVFTSPAGGPLRHTNFRRRFWVPALEAGGLAALHFHDLRHTGNMLAADAGANLRERWSGWGTPRPGPRRCTCTAATSGSRRSRMS
jgi:integrase